MNTDIKWEAVEYGDLKYNDRARITNSKGDVIYGQMEGDRFTCDFGDVGAVSLDEVGYSFERAVPERTLPNEPGIYTLRSHLPITSYVVARGSDGRWWDDRREPLDERDVPDDLVRLVPVTEAEELRKRIEQADAFIAARTNYYLDSTDIKAIRRYLVGEAANV